MFQEGKGNRSCQFKIEEELYKFLMKIINFRTEWQVGVQVGKKKNIYKGVSKEKVNEFMQRKERQYKMELEL